MATDAVIVEQVGQAQLGETESILAQFKPLPLGRNFVISAKGSVNVTNAHAYLTLQVSGVRDSVEINFADGQGVVSFSLVIGFDTPADPDFYSAAQVVGFVRPHMISAIYIPSAAYVSNIKLVILAVDSLQIQPSSN